MPELFQPLRRRNYSPVVVLFTTDLAMEVYLGANLFEQHEIVSAASVRGEG